MANKIRRLSRPLDFVDGDDLAALDEAANGSPRAAAIVTTALVEDALRWCLCGFLTPDADRAELPALDHADVFDNEIAPLKTFHAKIVIGYSLGIYGTVTRDDLQRMKRIRNAFAHSPRSITFETREVSSECLGLRYLDTTLANMHKTIEFDDNNPRQKFLETARLLILDLHAIGFPKSDKRHLEKML